MTLPNVTMQLPSGSNTPTQVHLPDGSTVYPNASGEISVASNFVGALLAGGWQIVIAANQTHVP